MKTLALLVTLILVNSSISLGQCNLSIYPQDPIICSGDSVNLSVVQSLYSAMEVADFNNYSLPSGWTVTGSPAYGSVCGPGADGSAYIVMNQYSTTGRIITSPSLDLSCGGMINFDMKFNVHLGSTSCDGPDYEDEGLQIEYSTDLGTTWNPIIYYAPDGTTALTNPMTSNTTLTQGAMTQFTSWDNYSIQVPAGAMTPNTLFRWNQMYYTGPPYDGICFDNLVINYGCSPYIVDWSTGELDTLQVDYVGTNSSPVIAYAYDSLGTLQCTDTTYVTIQSFPLMFDADSICYGESYTFADGTTMSSVTNSLVHTNNLSSTYGCDSVVLMDLFVYPHFEMTIHDTICSGEAYTFINGQTINSITSNYSHTSQFTSSVTGCDSIYVTEIFVNQDFNNLITDSVCKGSDYIFPDLSEALNIQSNVSHTSYLSTTEGCDSVITTNLIVKSVDVSVVPAGDLLAANNSNGAYVWLDCDNNFQVVSGQTSQFFNATQSGSFAVQITENGCVDTSACYSAIADLSELNKNSKFVAYPNPTSNLHTVLFDEVQEEIEIHVYDNFGKLCFHKKAKNTNMVEFELEVSKGVYRVDVGTIKVFESYPLIYLGE